MFSGKVHSFFAVLLSVLFIVGCETDQSKKSEAELKAAKAKITAIEEKTKAQLEEMFTNPLKMKGSWQILSSKDLETGDVFKHECGAVEDPFTLVEEYGPCRQLVIDGSTVTMINTDFIDFEEEKRMYINTGSYVTTIDSVKDLKVESPNFKNKEKLMVNFKVLKATDAILEIELYNDENESLGESLTYKKIDQAANIFRGSLKYRLDQSIHVKGTNEKNQKIEVLGAIRETADKTRDGLYYDMDCYVDAADNLNINFSQRLYESEILVWVPRTEGESISYTIPSMKIDEVGPSSKKTSKETVNVYAIESVIGGENLALINDGKDLDCNSEVNRNGAVLEIMSSCTSVNTSVSFKVEGQCILDSNLGTSGWMYEAR